MKMGAGEMLGFWALTLLILPGVLGGQWAVRYPEKPVCAVRGSTVVFPCTYDYPDGQQVMEKMWCRNHPDCINTTYVCHSGNINVRPEYKNRAECLDKKEKNCSLKIKNIKPTDAGVYRLRFTTDKDKWFGKAEVTLKVVELKVKLASSAGNRTIREGDSVNVTCGSEICSLSQSQFTWSKDSRRLPETQSTLHLSPVSLHHSGNYSCAVKGVENIVFVKFSLSVEAAGSMPGSASKSVGLLILFAMIPVLLLVVALVVILSVRRSKQGPLTAEHSKENGRERACRESGRDPYTTLDIKSRSPDYDILMGATASGRHSHIHTELQTAAEAPIYENIKLRG